MKKIVSIPESNVEKFENVMKNLVKLSKKLGNGDVEYNLIKQEVRLHKFSNNKQEYIMFYDYEISGETPTLNGYTLVAILERQNKLNLINHINKDIELPEGLQERGNYCEHCKSNRPRKYLFILKEEKTGEIIQVGKTCVKDFTGGHQNPQWVADWYSNVQELEDICEVDEESWATGRHTEYVESMKIIAFSAFFTDKEGYIKTMNGTVDKPSTVQKALRYDEYTTEQEVRDAGYFEKAEEVKQWIMSQNTSNDYILNLQTLIREEIIDARKAGYLASAYFSYQKALKQQEQEKEAEKKKESEYVGEVGKREEFTLIFDRKIMYDTDFGTMKIYFFYDEDGNLFIWKTSKYIGFKHGEKVTMKATIKEHNEYNGIKQNVLTRCTNIVVA